MNINANPNLKRYRKSLIDYNDFVKKLHSFGHTDIQNPQSYSVKEIEFSQSDLFTYTYGKPLFDSMKSIPVLDIQDTEYEINNFYGLPIPVTGIEAGLALGYLLLWELADRERSKKGQTSRYFTLHSQVFLIKCAADILKAKAFWRIVD